MKLDRLDISCTRETPNPNPNPNPIPNSNPILSSPRCLTSCRAIPRTATPTSLQWLWKLLYLCSLLLRLAWWLC